ncbi:MAG: prephenate dehydrogenase [Candidatus Promineifilaceae bacterium]|jgi:prephenate dehydrogenase
MINHRVCIAGLGLMGGSMAQALKGKAGRVTGVDRHAATRQQALADGVVDFAPESLAVGVSDADIVILAMPVRAILDALHELPVLIPDGCFVLDLGSTKAAINEAMSELPPGFAALGGHPMCGKETAGYRAADPTLFQGQTFILTRNERTTPEIERLALAIIDLIGAKPLFMEAQQHDRLTAAVSHLPYVLSAALMRFVSQQKDDYLWQTSASGFRDVSRLAGSDPQMLLDILLTNKTAVLEQLKGYQVELQEVIRLLAGADEKTLAAWLSEAQRRHIAYRKAKTDLE